MVIGGRRRLLAALGAVAVALALAIAATGRGCAESDSSPERAAAAFVRAARAGDESAVWELLGPDTRARLEAASQSATDKAGNAHRFTPLELLDVSVPENAYVPVGVRLVSQDAQRARVEVLGPSGQSDAISLVQLAGRWRVELLR